METCQRTDFIDDLKRNRHPIIRLPAGQAFSSDCLSYACRMRGHSTGLDRDTMKGFRVGAMPQNTSH